MSHPSLDDLGWSDRVAALFTLVDAPDHVPGRVVRSDRGSILVGTAVGSVRADPYALASRRAGLEVEPVTGDWVALVDDPTEGWVVVDVVPRWSELSREDPEPGVTRQQVLVANVDVVAVVNALDRPVPANRVERMLAAVWSSGAVPVVVLTKADLLTGPATARDEVETVAGGVEVLVTSAVDGAGVDDLRTLVGDRTVALLGPSGAGKSTLINRLAGADVQATGEVRATDHRGKHTTAARELVAIAGGGVLVDTPGLRSMALWDAEDGIAGSFPEIDELATACRFRDCAHAGEPGCAVEAAVDDGTLPARRLESYRKLEREAAALERRQQARDARAAGKRFARAVRTHRRLEPGRWRRDR